MGKGKRVSVVVLGWLSIVVVAVALAAASGLVLRGRSAVARSGGALLVAALGAAAWFLLVEGLMLAPGAVTTALGLSISLNIGLVAWFIADRAGDDASVAAEQATADRSWETANGV